MRWLFIAIMAIGCNDEPPEYRLADPNCGSYVAIPGEPCRAGLYLDVPFRPRGTPIATCRCAVVLVEKKR